MLARTPMSPRSTPRHHFGWTTLMLTGIAAFALVSTLMMDAQTYPIGKYVEAFAAGFNLCAAIWSATEWLLRTDD